MFAGLSTRAANCLRNNCITSIEEARLWTESEFLRSPNVGRKTLAEINAWRFSGLSEEELSALRPKCESFSERRSRLKLELGRELAVSIDHMVSKFNLDGRDGFVRFIREMGRDAARRWLLENFSMQRHAIRSLLAWVYMARGPTDKRDLRIESLRVRIPEVRASLDRMERELALLEKQ